MWPSLVSAESIGAFPYRTKSFNEAAARERRIQTGGATPDRHLRRFNEAAARERRIPALKRPRNFQDELHGFNEAAARERRIHRTPRAWNYVHDAATGFNEAAARERRIPGEPAPQAARILDNGQASMRPPLASGGYIDRSADLELSSTDRQLQ